MAMRCTWRGWIFEGAPSGSLHVQTPAGGGLVDPASARSLADMLVALAAAASADATAHGDDLITRSAPQRLAHAGGFGETVAGPRQEVLGERRPDLAAAMVTEATPTASGEQAGRGAGMTTSATPATRPAAVDGSATDSHLEAAAPGRLSGRGALPSGAAAEVTSLDVALAGSLGSFGRQRAGTSIRRGGKLVKRGPAAALERWRARGTGRPPVTTATSMTAPAEGSGAESPTLRGESSAPRGGSPAAPGAGPRVAAGPGPIEPARSLRPAIGGARSPDAPAQPLPLVLSEPGAASLAGADPAGQAQPLSELLRTLDPRARLLKPLVIWMASVNRPVSMAEIVAEAVRAHWSSSTEPRTVLTAAMQRNAQLFSLDASGHFSLRGLRPEGRQTRHPGGR